jgi:hypothetical protein
MVQKQLFNEMVAMSFHPNFSTFPTPHWVGSTAPAGGWARDLALV